MSALTLPTVQNGRGLWLDPEVQSIVDMLHNGVPALGWEGDERLALYRTEDGRWELWRLEDDGEMRCVCRSRPGMRLDETLIMRLVEHDSRKRDVMADLIRDNDALEDRRQKEAIDALMEPMDKVLWGVVKDVGHLY